MSLYSSLFNKFQEFIKNDTKGISIVLINSSYENTTTSNVGLKFSTAWRSFIILNYFKQREKTGAFFPFTELTLFYIIEV